jgi:hypothetical protein
VRSPASVSSKSGAAAVEHLEQAEDLHSKPSRRDYKERRKCAKLCALLRLWCENLSMGSGLTYARGAARMVAEQIAGRASTTRPC